MDEERQYITGESETAEAELRAVQEQEPAGQQSEQITGQKKGKRKKIIFFAALVVVLAAAVVFLILFNRPKARVSRAIAKTWSSRERINADAMEPYLGLSGLDREMKKTGGTESLELSIDKMAGFDVKDPGLQIKTARDMKRKTFSLDAGFTSDQAALKTLSLQMYSDGKKTWIGSSGVLKGYFSVNNRDFLKQVRESSFSSASDADAESEKEQEEDDIDLNDYLFPSASGKNELDPGVKRAEQELWKYARAENRGKETVRLNGTRTRCGAVDLVFRKEDVHKLIREAGDGYLRGYLAGDSGKGLSDEDRQTLSDEMNDSIKSVQDMVTDDVIVTVYLKSGRIVSLETQGELKGNAGISYDISLQQAGGKNPLRDILLEAEIGNQREKAADEESSAESYKISGEWKNDVTNAGAEKNLTISLKQGDTDVLGLTWEMKYDAEDQTVRGNGSLTTSSTALKMSMSGVYTKMEKEKSYTLSIPDISVTSGGTEFLNLSLTRKKTAGSPQVAQRDTSLPVLDILQADEKEIQEFTEKNVNQDNETQSEKELSELFGSLTGREGEDENEDADGNDDPDAETETDASYDYDYDAFNEDTRDAVTEINSSDTLRTAKVGDTVTVDGLFELTVTDVESTDPDPAGSIGMYKADHGAVIHFSYKNIGWTDTSGSWSGLYLTPDYVTDSDGNAAFELYADADIYPEELPVGKSGTYQVTYGMSGTDMGQIFFQYTDGDGNLQTIRFDVEEEGK